MLQQKLNSKTEALIILSNELARARTENEEYQDLTFQLNINQQLKHPFPRKSKNINYSTLLSIKRGRNDGDNNFTYRRNAISDHLVALRADNLRLSHERARLRQLLQERDEDVRMMRSLLKKSKALTNTHEYSTEEEENPSDVVNVVELRHVEEKGELISKLENLSSKYSQLKQDLQVLRCHSIFQYRVSRL